MHRGARLFIFGLVLAGLAQAQADWRFAHPDADVRMSVNVQAVLKAPAVTEILRQKDQPAQVQTILALLSSVDRISISARQTGQDQDVLALVTGSFDPSLIQPLFPSNGSGQVKQVGPHAILIGEGVSFTQAVQRMTGAAAAGSSDELERSDVWIAGKMAQAPPAFQAMQAFSFGLNLGDSPEMNVVVDATDSAGAVQALIVLREILRPLGPALEAKQDGPKVRLHFLLPPEMLRFAQAQAASGSFGSQLQPLMGMLGLAGTPPANGGKIMIYGLDEGPREVKTK